MIPWVSRAVYRMQEAAMRRPTFTMLAEIERTQWLPRESVDLFRRMHLTHFCRTRWPTVPDRANPTMRPAWRPVRVTSVPKKCFCKVT